MSSSESAAAVLFREVFEGVGPGADGTWFVQGKEAIFDAITSLSPDDASRRVSGQQASIGAHVYHLNYYLSLFNATVRGESPDSDWEGSWAHQAFDAKAWADLESDVRSEYNFALNWYRANPTAKDLEQETYALANLAHAAYHLGAIRSLIGIVMEKK